MDNLVMIGMPGSGKSTVGVVLAKAAGMDFVDSDLVIQKEMGMTLAQIIERYGDDGFRQIENRVNASLDCHGTVIATGGSVVYGEDAMRHLQHIGTVIYLQVSCEEISARLGDLHARGVTFAPGQTLQSLYEERRPLYERYADITLPCDGLTIPQVIEALRARLECFQRSPSPA